MVTKIITKLSVAKRKGKNLIYRSPRIYLSTKITDDSLFPFNEGDKISVKITGKKLMIEKYNTKNKRKRVKSKKSKQQ